MTDRDFKLLVREYFQGLAQSKFGMNEAIQLSGTIKWTNAEKCILSELEDFTRRDVEELPFKETEI